jgi:hypothetical protein
MLLLISHSAIWPWRKDSITFLDFFLVAPCTMILPASAVQERGSESDARERPSIHHQIFLLDHIPMPCILFSAVPCFGD